MCIFSDFRIILGVPWESLWRHVCDFSLIWGVKMGDGFQVHVFSDPGMEMMLESGGCMCYKHSKNNGFSDISFFPLFQEISVSRGVLGVILVAFGGLGDTFSDFGGYWEQA